MSTSFDNWRKEIDEVDEKLLILLQKRTELTHKIGEYKKAHNLPILDETYWNKKIQRLIEKAKIFLLDTTFITSLFTIIHQQSVKEQEK